MQTIVYQCDTAMPAQKLPNCCYYIIGTIKYYYRYYHIHKPACRHRIIPLSLKLIINVV